MSSTDIQALMAAERSATEAEASVKQAEKDLASSQRRLDRKRLEAKDLREKANALAAAAQSGTPTQPEQGKKQGK